MTATLFADFDSVTGKAMYTGQPDDSYRSYYTGVHPYLFVGVFLDPRQCGLSHSDRKDFIVLC